MCAECTFIEEEDVPMIFDENEDRTNLLAQSCCGGSCACKK